MPEAVKLAALVAIDAFVLATFGVVTVSAQDYGSRPPSAPVTSPHVNRFAMPDIHDSWTA